MTAEHDRLDALASDVLRSLTDLDPYGLDPGDPKGAPADEYDLEARPIAHLLMQHGTVTGSQVETVWLEYFGEPLSAVVGAARVAALVAGLNGLLLEHRQ